MAKVYIRPPRSGDAEALAAAMRAPDCREVEASSPLSRVECVRASLAASFLPGAAITPSGELICLFGAAPDASTLGVASPWCLGTDLLFGHPLELTRVASRYFKQVQAFYPVLQNYVDARNVRSVAWLRRLGFTLDEPEPMFHRGVLFHRFYKGTPACASRRA